jgi:hypothetical protein
MNEQDWAEQKAKEIREKRETEKLDKQNRILEDKQRSSEAPELWKKFVEAARSKVQAFNNALKEQALILSIGEDEKLHIAIHQGLTEINAEMNSRLALHCMLVNTSMEYPVAVINGRVTFVTGRPNDGRAIKPEEIAEKFVDSIIKFL